MAKHTQTDGNNFVLKHRIVGAAFLLFFGALVLPWLLGPPQQTKIGDQSEYVNFENSDILSDDFTKRLDTELITDSQDLDVLEDELLNTQETVYLSKITPIDSYHNGVQNQTTTNSNKSSQQQSDSSVKNLTANSQAVKDIKQKTDASVTPPKDLTAEPTVAAKSNSTIPATASPIKPKVTVGWAVQVGVFIDKKGADKVIADLRDKGFQPSTTIVDTNRGPATGNRVWLGPFAERVEAAKTKSRLTQQTGERGFIRAYP